MCYNIHGIITTKRLLRLSFFSYSSELAVDNTDDQQDKDCDDRNRNQSVRRHPILLS
jgi:hypothetical protein